MNSARSYLNLAFFREYACDVHVSPTTTAEFLDQFTVRLQARARRFVGQGIQDFLNLASIARVPSYLPLYFKSHEQSLD